MFLFAGLYKRLDSISPLVVWDLRDLVTVRFERGQILVEAQSRMAGKMSDTGRRRWRVERRCSNQPSDVINRDHVDGVVDVRS